ncbi:MAG: LPS assembly protein LptD [Deltaproteobacteria bacterium]|nr:LPS assembly protein LptD [Deltaproteobacteria bacterium]
MRPPRARQDPGRGAPGSAGASSARPGTPSRRPAGLAAFFLAVMLAAALARAPELPAQTSLPQPPSLAGALNPPAAASGTPGPEGEGARASDGPARPREEPAPWPGDVPPPGPFPDEAFPASGFSPRSWDDPALYGEAGRDLAGLWDDAPPPGDRVRMVVSDSEPPVVVEADELRHDRASGRVEFAGRVVVTRGEEVIAGRRALWHDPTQTAEISGEVRMSTPDFRATAARVAVNMDLRLAKLYDGKAFFPRGHYYVEGDVIERQGAETIYVNQAVFTTCDGPEPSWRLKASNLLINRGGLATATGVSFSNKWFPMFYAPYFAVPIKGERQTGFLIPEIGNSNRDGVTVSAPFFWELAEDYDLTATPVWRSSRGLAMTLEGRYNFSAGTGVGLVTYLKDRQDNFYNYQNPGLPPRNSKNLFWLRSQNSWHAAGWNLNLDLDVVSDPLFLYAFRNDVDGFFVSQKLFTDYFGRTVNEELDPVRLSTFFAQKAGADTYFRGSLTYSDNLYRRRNLDTLQNLPRLQFNLVSRPLGSGPAMPGSPGGPRVSLGLQYDYFTRRSDANSLVSETGHRLTAAPSVFWNLDFGSFMNLKLDAGANLAAYAARGDRPAPTASGRAPHDGLAGDLSGTLNLELTTSLSRVYDVGPGDAVQTLHQVSPLLAFEIVKAPGEEELPYFDMLDRRLNRRTFKYGLRNTLTTKTPVRDADGGITGHAYNQILKLGIYSSYEFASNIARASRDHARYYTTGYFDRGVGPLELELESDVLEGVQARVLSRLDGRSGKFTRHEISLNARNKRGDSLGLIYDYDNPTIGQGPSAGAYNISQIRGDVNLNLTHGWSASISSRFDFVQDKELESYFTLRYGAQCYGVSFIFSSTYDDRKVGLVFDLLGLGAIGTPTTRLSSEGG